MTLPVRWLFFSLIAAVLVGCSSNHATPDKSKPAGEKVQGGKQGTNYSELELGGGVKMKLVRIDPGKFWMGSPEKEEDRRDDEFLHEVEITQPYYLGVYEVTRGQFRAFVDAEGYKTESEKDGQGGSGYDSRSKNLQGPDPKYSWKFTGFDQTDAHPVVNVTWNDAKAFCRWLSDKTGRKVMLPTEAQWEYACRAGTKTRYSTGDAAGSLEGFANVTDLTLKDKFPKWNVVPFRDGYVFTAPVGKFKQNPWGLFDMHGNVWEWCEDWYGKDYYKEADAVRDPEGPKDGKFRVLRGGSWGNVVWESRAACRGDGVPGHRIDALGFRIAVRETKGSRLQ